MDEDRRLERMETKLDTLSEAVVSLARMEERMITLFRRMDQYDQEQVAVSKRVSQIEKDTGTNGQMLRLAERVFWIVFAAGFAFWLRGM